MIPDIELDECIEMLKVWSLNAIRMKEVTDDFEYVLIAHKYNQILKHLMAYQELKKEQTE